MITLTERGCEAHGRDETVCLSGFFASDWREPSTTCLNRGDYVLIASEVFPGAASGLDISHMEGLGVHPWQAEWDLTEEGVRRVISSQFPHLSIDRISLVGEGWDTWVYTVDGLFFRFPRRSMVCPTMVAEARILPRLAPLLPYPIPVPEWIGEPTADFPHPFFGYRTIVGQTLPDAVINPIAVARDLAVFLRALHSIGLSEGQRMGIGGPELRRFDIPRLKERLLEWIDRARAGGIAVDTPNLLEEFHLMADKSIVLDSPVVVHGDLNFKNLIMRQGRLAGIIDWTDVHLGHPGEDWSIVHGLLPYEAQRVFFEHYGSVTEEAWSASRFLAIYVNLIVLVSSQESGQPATATYAQHQLNRILSAPRTLVDGNG